MDIKKLLYIGFKRFRQNKKRNLMLIIPLSICITLMIFANMIQYSITEYYDEIDNNIKLRTIVGIKYTLENYNNIYEQLAKIDNIKMIFTEDERDVVAISKCEQLSNGITDGIMEINPINKEICPEVMYGRKIDSLDSYEIILPNKIYADSKFIDPIEDIIQEEDYLDGLNFLNKKIIINFNDGNESINKEFKVVGIYDCEKYHSKSAYIPQNIVKKINDELGYKSDILRITIVVDKFKNIEKVNNILKEKGLLYQTDIEKELAMFREQNDIRDVNFSNVSEISLEMLKIIKKIKIYLSICSIIIFITVLITINTNKSYENIVEIGILKVEGYKNKYIQLITVFENIIVCIITVFIAFIFFHIIKMIGNNIINDFILRDTIGITANEMRRQLYFIQKIPQKINYVYLIYITIVLISFITINNVILNCKILKKQINEILEKNEY